MLVYTPDSDRMPNVADVGEKAFNLSRLHELQVTVPGWMAVTAEAFSFHVPDEITMREPQEVAAYIETCEIQPGLQKEIEDCAGRYFWDQTKLCAVRSSAVGEDSAEHSFAGQLESFLYVPFGEVFGTIKKVWLSAFSERAVAYREKAGISGKPVRVAVIIQEMIDAETAGVAFGINPVTGERNAVVISAVYGLGEGLVSGLLDADTYTVRYCFTKEGIPDISFEEHIIEKEKAVAFDRESGKYTGEIEVPQEKRLQPCLSREQMQEIASLTMRLCDYFKGPQDIEWAVAAGKVYLLQSRPVTTLDVIPDSTAPERIWDNANIVESYAGVTTPLTFSFVQEIYTEVYQNFCRIMGVEEEIIQRNRAIFSMLGLVKGRIYYNLNSWYQVLSLLPGYSINASFMEQMMGVTEKSDIPPTVVYSGRNRYLRVFGLIRKLIRNFRTLPKQRKEFFALLDNVLQPVSAIWLEHCSPHQLKEQYIHLEQSLLQRWQAPLINDFFAMIFHGVLKKLITKWGIDTTETLQNDLLCGEGGIISTEPVTGMIRIANYIINNDALLRFITGSSDREIVARLHLGTGEAHEPMDDTLGELREKIIAHLSRFGDRCVNELKLETVTPNHDPSIFIRMLKSYCKAGYTDLQKADKNEKAIRDEAERRVKAKLRCRPLRKMLFSFILKHARQLLKNRENLRFERTRLYARVREIFRALGTRFERERYINEKRDIFYLTKDEVFNFIEGTAVHTDLKEIIALRKKQFAAYHNEKVPNRFTTRGVVYHTRSYTPAGKTAALSDNRLQGIGCCPGVVKARVCIVDDPNNAPDITGCIMVAQKTDPGWAPLFPMAQGLLVERGSLLSHSAIVAREMGIPAIVGISDLIATLTDGETVEMDGNTGTVFLLERNG